MAHSEDLTSSLPGLPNKMKTNHKTKTRVAIGSLVGSACCVVLVLVTLLGTIFVAYSFSRPVNANDSPWNTDMPKSANGFTIARANALIQYSSATYCSPPTYSADVKKVKDWTCGNCLSKYQLTNITVVQDKGTDGYAIIGLTKNSAFDNTTLIIAFRGSHTAENWRLDEDIVLVNFDAKITNDKSVKVHRGFQTIYMALRPAILEAVRSLTSSTPTGTFPTSITGHSLGASLATVCAFDFALNGASVGAHLKEVYSFGAPRAGDKAFATSFRALMERTETLSWRVVHGNDFAPRAIRPDHGFHHVGREVWFTDKQDAHVFCDGSGEDPLCSASLGTSVLTQSLRAHDFYVDLKGVWNCPNSGYESEFAWVIPSISASSAGLSIGVLLVVVAAVVLVWIRKRARGKREVDLALL